MKLRSLIAAAALIGGFYASAASAQPNLVSATPVANATVGRTDTVRLIFSEKLTTSVSSATLLMTGMQPPRNEDDGRDDHDRTRWQVHHPDQRASAARWHLSRRLGRGWP